MRHKAQFTHLLVMLCAALVAHAEEPPKLKPGLWEMSTTSAGSKRPPRSINVCIGSDTLSLLTRLEGTETPQQNCLKSKVQVEGMRVTTDASCKLDASQISTHTVTTYQSSSAFHSETQAHYEPPLFGKHDGQSTRDAKWLGECAAGMRPGDVTLSNGMKMNLLDVAGAAK